MECCFPDIVESVDRDSGGSTSDSQDSNVAAQDYKSPVGVTVIGDDEDEVQLGMQKAMRLPRYAPLTQALHYDLMLRQGSEKPHTGPRA